VYAAGTSAINANPPANTKKKKKNVINQNMNVFNVGI
jgi:hypothetical protein